MENNKTNLEKSLEQQLGLDGDHKSVYDVVYSEEDQQSKSTAIVEQSSQLKAQVATIKKTDLDKDLRFVKENIRDVLKDSAQVLAEAVVLASSSQAPRMYEVVGNLIKIITEANEKLIEVHKKASDIENAGNKNTDSGGAKSVTQNNAYFYGTSEELSNKLSGKLDNNRSG